MLAASKRCSCKSILRTTWNIELRLNPAASRFMFEHRFLHIQTLTLHSLRMQSKILISPSMTHWDNKICVATGSLIKSWKAQCDRVTTHHAEFTVKTQQIGHWICGMQCLIHMRLQFVTYIFYIHFESNCVFWWHLHRNFCYLPSCSLGDHCRYNMMVWVLCNNKSIFIFYPMQHSWRRSLIVSCTIIQDLSLCCTNQYKLNADSLQLRAIGSKHAWVYWVFMYLQGNCWQLNVVWDMAATASDFE